MIGGILWIKKWIYYRIFADPNDQLWYYKLLTQVVKPFILENNTIIERFFFFHYCQKYEAEENCEMKFNDNDRVAFISLRILAKSSQLQKLDNSLLNFINRSSSALEFEICERYDVD